MDWGYIAICVILAVNVGGFIYLVSNSLELLVLD